MAPSRLPNPFAARLSPPPILPGPLPFLRAGRLRDELILLAPIFAEPVDHIDPTELIEPTLAPDNLIALSSPTADPALQGRDVRTSMSSTSELPLPRRGGESVVANGAANSANVGPSGGIGSSWDCETVVGRNRRCGSCRSSCVPNVVMLSNEAIDVAALPFPPNVSIVPIDVFKPVE
jgi:hypothetical protein